MKTIFLGLLFVSLNVIAADVKPAHTACKEDSDCILVGESGCCGADFTINKKFSKEHPNVVDPSCKAKTVTCMKVQAVCISKQCVIQKQ